MQPQASPRSVKSRRKYAPRGLTLTERLAWSSRRDDNDCLIWTGETYNSGYGRLKGKAVHRLTWAAKHGPIPKGMFVCHRCDVRACFEIDHLFLGTAADNNADMMAKGRFVALPGEANGMAKLTRAQVMEIIADKRIGRVIAAQYGIKQAQVSRIKRGQSWGAL